jgi:hypothetical protein
MITLVIGVLLGIGGTYFLLKVGESKQKFTPEDFKNLKDLTAKVGNKVNELKLTEDERELIYLEQKFKNSNNQ